MYPDDINFIIIFWRISLHNVLTSIYDIIAGCNEDENWCTILTEYDFINYLIKIM